MKWWRFIFDERLPKGCRLFPACLSCPAYCEWKKVSEKEILGYDREEETKRIIERIKNARKEEKKNGGVRK